VEARRNELLLSAGGVALGVGSVAIGHANLAQAATGVILGASLGAGPRHPRIAWVTAAIAASVAAPFGTMPFAVALMSLVPAFVAGRWDERWWGVAGLVALVAAWQLNSAIAGDDGYVPALMLPSAAWLAGRALRERSLVAERLAERVRELDEEREAHAALSVRYERARIASELHDIVAHAISVMVVQASAGQRLAARDPDATAQSFAAIADAARQAEQDMGRLVVLLGDEDAIGPAPDLVLVEELVGRAAGSGLDVTLRLEGEREGLPAPVVELAYRVVQEAMTNALRYASGAPVRVALRGEREALAVEVSNGPAVGDADLAGVGTGNGLRGLRERVGACGGVLEAGPAAGGGWTVRVRLPRRAAVTVQTP
jgi:signal transduction histidine kinase